MSQKPFTQPHLNVVNYAKAFIRSFDEQYPNDADRILKAMGLGPEFTKLYRGVKRLEALEQANHDFVMVKYQGNIVAMKRHLATTLSLQILWSEGAKTADAATSAFAKHIVETQLMPSPAEPSPAKPEHTSAKRKPTKKSTGPKRRTPTGKTLKLVKTGS